MSTNPAIAPSRRETESERASRVRDNKRRHRARQREYVLDLERKVAESREQGVQATKEVQLAAQRVARENAKLRELLSSIGYTNSAIDAWVKGDESVQNGRSKKTETQKAEPDHSLNEGALGPIETTGGGGEGCLPNASLPPTKSPTACTAPAPPPSAAECRSDINADAPCAEECTATCAQSCTPSATQPPESTSTVPPCQLLTLLAKNPAADITQLPLPESESEPQGGKDGSADGVECAAAYKMLIHYATSDEKMDKIAAALESGCTPTAGGGCRVKKSVVWKALDEDCI